MAAAAAGRTVSEGRALVIITLGVFLGPIVLGTAVAGTIATGIADFPRLGVVLLAAAICGAIVARIVMYVARVPASGSVALVGAIVGAVWAGPGLSAVHWHGVEKVAIVLVVSPLVGFLAGALAYALVLLGLSVVSRRTGERLMQLQYATIALQALGFGANDAEKAVGLFAAALLVAGGGTSFAAPFWTIALTAVTFAIGMALGGVRIARTVANRLFSIRPAHALAFQFASASTVIAAAMIGGPVSSTQTTASAIFGVGASDNPRTLHWQTAFHIVVSWFVTAPVAVCAGALSTFLLRTIFR